MAKKSEEKKEDHWYDKLTQSKTVRIIATIAAIITFVTQTLVSEDTFKGWKRKFEASVSNLFETTSDVNLLESYTFKKKPSIYLDFPKFEIENDSGETDTLKKVIVNKVLTYFEQDPTFEVIDTHPTNYFELEKILQNYHPSKEHSQNIKVVIDKETIKSSLRVNADSLSDYLYISILKSSDSLFKDTLQLNYINFDRKTKKTINLDSLFTPLFQSFVDKYYTEHLKKNTLNIFLNDYFYLSPNFFLTDESIDFQYVRQKDTTEFQGVKIAYKLSIPYDYVKEAINPKNKLTFFLKRKY